MQCIDRDLIVSIAGKSTVAFDQLYHRYSRLFYSWVYTRIGDADITNDILQNLWIAVWVKPDFVKTDEAGSAKNFLLHFLTFRVLDYFRMAEVNLTKTTVDRAAVYREEDSYTHVLEELHVKDICEVIEEVLSSLPNLSREVFLLRWEEDLSVQEAARHLSVSETTVRNRYEATLNILRVRLTAV